MNIWVAVTDMDWFQKLRSRQPEEVNFWQPGGGRRIRRLQPGDLFLFKLHSPYNAIAGGGFFVRSTSLPVRLAWEAFGPMNGVDSLSEFRTRIAHYRRKETAGTTEIGCNILAHPFFFEEYDWIPQPGSWSKNIVTAKTYDGTEGEGAEFYQQVAMRVSNHELLPPGGHVQEGGDDRWGRAFLARARLGQGAFRVLVTDAYDRRCAVTGERTLPTLEAAHIRPYAEHGPHQVSNGLLLRSDWHRLFDDGYVTVTPDHHIEVSPRIREEYENGREYYRHHGERLARVPETVWQRPDPEFIRWHNEQVYRG
ncbi:MULTISPECIES: HNH endonuclease [unclassified Thioalkalivibrio]|uniref:HNH endonuclease n=1 Tax=unclassified Thioalkalivibrio TaxID=2621013 RepID=UPI000372AD65|nr:MULTISPECIES: HNH endonuclease [unclassified Thioalkalivibrio]